MQNAEKLPLDILVVDDDNTTLATLNAILKKHVDSIYTAKSGIEALEIYCAAPHINVVITDIHMPEMDGIELTARIKKINPNILVLAITGNYDYETIIAGIKAGFANVLKKPITFAEIYTLLVGISIQIQVAKEKIRQEKILSEYQKALDASYIVSKTDLNGIITYVNDKFCEVSGYTKDELIGKAHNIVRHPSMPTAAFAELWSTIQSKQIWRGRVVNKKKDGTSYVVDSTVVPILDENDNIVEYISMRQDITKMVETNRKLVKEQQEKAETAKIHYEELAKAKSALLGLFSHELKTPLNAIVNFSKIVARRIDGIIPDDERADMNELMTHIVENAEKIEAMISAIVDVMKLQAGNVALKPRQMTFVELINDRARYILDTSKLQIVKNIILEPSQINIDPSYAVKILDNIYSNAVKYAKQTVSLTYKEENGNFFFILEDDGCGFANPQKAMELFWQDDDNLLTRQSTGVGIGLHHTKLCCDALGWKLELSNACGLLGGACVTISGRLRTIN